MQLSRFKHCLLLTVVLAGTMFPLIAASDSYIVNSLEDAGPGSLREQIASAPEGASILFAARGTIVLTSGELVISKKLKIVGPGITNLTISAGYQSRILNILPGSSLHLSDLTIREGRAAEGTAGTTNNPTGEAGSDGGGIYNAGYLTIRQCVIGNCAAGGGGAGFMVREAGTPDGTNWVGGSGGRGGAIYNLGKLAVDRSVFMSNSSGPAGAAGGTRLYGAQGSDGGGGGAIYNAGEMRLTGCSFNFNMAGEGSEGFNVYDLMISVGGQQAGGSGGNGGAICDVGTFPTSLVACQFRSNASGAGGDGSTYRMYAQLEFGGNGGPGGSGGAVWAQGAVQMDSCAFVSNHTGAGAAGGVGIQSGGNGGFGGLGGAIYGAGKLSLKDCLCVSNYTGFGGDGGKSFSGLGGAGGTGGSGGAVFAAGDLRLMNSTLRENWVGFGGRGGNGSSKYNFDPGFGPGFGGQGGSGGALYCQSTLAATNSTFSGNEAGTAGASGYAGFDPGMGWEATTTGSDGGRGGGIFAVGPVMLHACTIARNRGGSGSAADGSLSALYSSTKASLAASDEDGPLPIHSYWRHGRSGGAGGTGGIWNGQDLTIVLSTVCDNVGGTGGLGGYSYSTFSGGIGGPGGAGGAGAIHSVGTNLVLVACTIARNRGGPGGSGGAGSLPYSYSNDNKTGQGAGGAGGCGGVFNANTDPVSSAQAISTIAASNVGGAGGASGSYPNSLGAPGSSDVQGSFTSLGHNLIGQLDWSSEFTTGAGDIVGSTQAPVDPVLGALADNGGKTLTLALLHNSPALNAGADALLHKPYALRRDQRGFPRKTQSQVDIGSFEFHAPREGSPSRPVVLGAVRRQTSVALSSGTETTSSGVSSTFHLTFASQSPGLTFSVLATTNLYLPIENWRLLGQAIRSRPGLFEFIDMEAMHEPQRFYRVTSP